MFSSASNRVTPASAPGVFGRRRESSIRIMRQSVSSGAVGEELLQKWVGSGWDDRSVNQAGVWKKSPAGESPAGRGNQPATNPQGAGRLLREHLDDNAAVLGATG